LQAYLSKNNLDHDRSGKKDAGWERDRKNIPCKTLVQSQAILGYAFGILVRQEYMPGSADDILVV